MNLVSDSQQNPELILICVLSDPRTNIVDICETQAVTFNDTFYLTINMKEVSRYKYCQCTIQNGWFALSMQDVRLKITGKNNCSSARLHVNKREISCKPNKVDFDSKFGILFNPRMKNAYIGVSYSSDDDKPEMVMLQGKPKGNKCFTYKEFIFPLAVKHVGLVPFVDI